jgi:NDP-sugar pyrophosphorylase family protein
VFEPEEFFDLRDPEVAALFKGSRYVWDLLARLPEVVSALLGGDRVIEGTVMPGAFVEDGPVFIGAGAVIEPGAYVKGPAYIGRSATVRHGAYVREDVILLERSILGHASEIKSSVLLPRASAPHFAYVGDSILGQRVNLGAGTKLSNVAVSSTRGSDGHRPPVVVVARGQRFETGLEKLGAILGDEVRVGCNAVFNPGTLMGPRCLVYPNAVVPKGFHEADRIIKLRQRLEIDPRLDDR